MLPPLASLAYDQGRRYWGGVTPPQNFKKSGKFGQNKGKFGQNNGKFCHKWQHLWLLVHPIKFGQFYKSRIFGQFNELWFRNAPAYDRRSISLSIKL